MLPAPAIAASAVAATLPTGAAVASPDLQLANHPQVPGAQDGAEFARAAQGASLDQGSPLDQGASVDMAALPPASDGIGGALMRQVEQMTLHMGGLNASMPAHPPGGPAATGLNQADMQGAVSQIEHAYSFAIETTMASRGSTESTKIFNTLLKGQ